MLCPYRISIFDQISVGKRHCRVRDFAFIVCHKNKDTTMLCAIKIRTQQCCVPTEYLYFTRYHLIARQIKFG